MKINISEKFKKILIYFLIVVAVIHIYQRYISKSYQYSVQSPDNEYTLEVYYVRRYFAMPGDGGLCGTPTYFRLLNDNGFEIGHSCRKCSPLACDIEIEFDKSNNCVWIARGSAIDLDTGKCGD